MTVRGCVAGWLAGCHATYVATWQVHDKKNQIPRKKQNLRVDKLASRDRLAVLSLRHPVHGRVCDGWRRSKRGRAQPGCARDEESGDVYDSAAAGCLAVVGQCAAHSMPMSKSPTGPVTTGVSDPAHASQ